jgi:hypothetical protein
MKCMIVSTQTFSSHLLTPLDHLGIVPQINAETQANQLLYNISLHKPSSRKKKLGSESSPPEGLFDLSSPHHAVSSVVSHLDTSDTPSVRDSGHCSR